MSITTGRDSIGAVETAASADRLTAMEAVVRLLLDQAALDRRRGLRTGGYASGYPGSPLGGLQSALERADEEFKKVGIHQAPGLNEELSATAIWGSQTVTELPGSTVDGVFGLWYGKAPGVDRAADALRHGNMRGTNPNGGVLVVAGDDPNANATVFPTDSTAAFATWGMPVLYPGSVQEILDLGHHGYELSRTAGLWVGFKLVTTVADGSGAVDTDLERLTFERPEVLVGGRPFAPTLRANDPGPPMREAERDLMDGRRRLAEKYIEVNRLNPVVIDPDEARIGIVAAGKSYFDLRRALLILGLEDIDLERAGVRIKKVSALHPIGLDEWRSFARDLDHVLVVEEKRPFLETALKSALYDLGLRPTITGKSDASGVDFLPQHGEFGPDLIARRLAPRLLDMGVLETDTTPAVNPRALLPVVSMETSRGLFFCSGCPHNTSLKAPEDHLVGAGIGCHIMSLVVDRPEYGNQTGFTQMGGEGAQWVGQAPFTTDDHIIQNVGDGTFHHSASLGVRLAVASEVNITFKLLYNSAVGMTGGQQVRGVMSVPDLTKALMAEGVKRIIVTTDDPKRHRRRSLAKGTQVWHRDRLIEAQEALADVKGVTVLIHDQQCAAERRRLWRRGEQEQTTERVMINDRICEGCGDCNDKSQCLSVQPIETPFGRKTSIQQTSCNLDFSCLKGDCPSFLTVDVKNAKKPRGASQEAPASPLPVRQVSREDFSAHMTGIGGTGVVSANNILAAAATLDGLKVRSLDLPGGSIKAGTVVSQMQVYPDGAPEPAATIDPGGADLFLGFDMLGAMTPANLEPLSPERTITVACLNLEPTGQMAVDPSIPLPSSSSLRSELDSRSRADANVYVDVFGLCDAVMGSRSSANAMLIGAAFQAGALPFSLQAMEQGFRESGVAVESNLRAFAWGRAAVSAPGRIAELGLVDRPQGGGVIDDQLTTLAAPFRPHPALHDLVVLRVEDLRDYQNLAYASRFAEDVHEMMVAELATTGGLEVTEAFARGLYKLMSYKDEYEVARLALLDSAKAAVVAEFGEGAKVSWNLHPPILRSLGWNKKLRLGPWFTPVFVALRALRRVRGTALDIFGLAPMRRMERRLRDEYRTMMRELAVHLTSANAAAALELAESAQLVRGYEFVKVRHTRDYLEAVTARTAALGMAYRPSDALVTLVEKSDEK